MSSEHSHNHAHAHTHAVSKKTKTKTLIYALCLTSTFLIAEMVGGFVTGSLALLSDAAHMLTDVAALAIALLAIYVGRRPADTERTFGYYRFEILAAVFNTLLLFLIAIYIIYEAYQRLFITVEIQSMGMLIIATLGLVINIISMRLLSEDKEKSLNIKGAYLEVWSDMIGSVGVIIAALLMRYTQANWVDSAVAILIGLWVLPRGWLLLKESINILLEGVPQGVNLSKLKETLCTIEFIIDIHDLHVWAITSGKISLTAHVVTASHQNCEEILDRMRKMLAEQFDIHHTTLQHETTACAPVGMTCKIEHR